MLKHQYRKRSSPDGPSNWHLQINAKKSNSWEGTQKAFRLVAFLFIIDSLPLHSPIFVREYRDKLSNFKSGLLAFPAFWNEKAEKLIENSYLGKLYRREPPDCRCFHSFEQRQS